MAAATTGGSAEASPPTRSEVLLDSGAGYVGDRHAAPLSLVAQASVEVIGELYGGAAHGDASIPLGAGLMKCQAVGELLGSNPVISSVDCEMDGLSPRCGGVLGQIPVDLLHSLRKE